MAIFLKNTHDTVLCEFINISDEINKKNYEFIVWCIVSSLSFTHMERVHTLRAVDEGIIDNYIIHVYAQIDKKKVLPSLTSQRNQVQPQMDSDQLSSEKVDSTMFISG